MKKRRQIEMFSISFLDLLSGALGAVIILYVAIPKNKVKENPEMDVEKEALSRELVTTKAELEKATDIIKALKIKMAAIPVEQAKPVVSEESKNGANFDVGFKFKGKNLVFIIDTSYSMIEEDRMGQVKAGLKMLLTSLPSTYKIEFVQYPLGERAPFKTLWGTTKDSSKFNKQDAFDFIFNLRPSGGTPTRDALLFVLRNYDDVSDLILLTDGVPTYHNSNQKDDIHDILKTVKEENHKKIQISTIGVGANFLNDQRSDQYRFLSQLAEQTGGFFVGF